jgi:hypothetical protein
LLDAERAWDGGDAFLLNGAEKFARRFAQNLGWDFPTD